MIPLIDLIGSKLNSGPSALPRNDPGLLAKNDPSTFLATTPYNPSRQALPHIWRAARTPGQAGRASREHESVSFGSIAPLFALRQDLHAFGVDDVESLFCFLFQILFNLVFSVWVTLFKHRRVISR